MSEYPKIENLYARCPDTHVCGPEHGLRVPEVGLISKWLVLEKVDGMNMRVVLMPAQQGNTEPWGSTRVNIYGRTDRAQIPGDLLAHMQETFTVEKLIDAFGRVCPEEGLLLPEREVTLYGEGFGPGIQKAGHAYGGAKRFVLFDVRIGDWWLKWADVQSIAETLGIPTVPVLAQDVELDLAKGYVRRSDLLTDPDHVEGIILRTDPYVFDQRGRRVMVKYKVRDL